MRSASNADSCPDNTGSELSKLTPILHRATVWVGSAIVITIPRTRVLPLTRRRHIRDDDWGTPTLQ